MPDPPPPSVHQAPLMVCVPVLGKAFRRHGRQERVVLPALMCVCNLSASEDNQVGGMRKACVCA
jgi:hypothetical protein